MSKRAEERALEFYPEKDFNKEPNYLHTCDSKMLDEIYRQVFMLGYEQAEKDLGWISVRERMPEPKQSVITCVDFNGVPQALDVCDYRNGKWYSWLSDRFVGYVDYWMPVQPLPKKEEQ